jgi:phosphatidyl-myo-inositol dimannoside synthase
LKKILLISSEFPPGPGGIGRHAADLSLALNNKGFVVNVFSTIDYVDNSKINYFISQLPPGIQLFPLKRYGWKTYINRVIIIFRELKKTKYERIIVTGKFPLWVGGIIKFIYRSRQHVDFFVHGSEVNPGNVFIRLLTHWSLKKADIIWAVSGFTASLLPIPIRKKKDIEILPNGIHATQWEGYKDSLPYSHWKGYPKLLTVGNIMPRKGQQRVIKALPEIIKVFPRVHYHIVGLPTHEKTITALAETLDVDKHITIHGKLAGDVELASAYKTADIFMMLSENQSDGDVEGFGIAILEANYWGIPAIGAKGSGIEDAIKTGINGELTDGDNAIKISGAIKKILDNNAMYKSNLDGWIQKHNWNTIVEKFIAKL